MTTDLWTRENLAWLAGWLEGEGAFLFYRKTSTKGEPYPAFRATVHSTDEDVLRRAASIAGCGTVDGPNIPRNPKHKTHWGWNVNRRDDVYALLVAIYPFMGSRRKERIEDILSVYRNSGKARFEHGTRSAYEHHKCRCPDCRSFNTGRHREFLASRREAV